jgi:c(7)-type cytochrome triheme protein
MRSRTTLTVLAVAALLGLACVGAVAAQDRLPKLPGPYTLAQTGDSPGKVTFNHASHVDPDAPDCTSCHPKVFRILKPGTATDGRSITHDAMTKGASCGACHGKKAFGFDDCTMCHHAE